MSTATFDGRVDGGIGGPVFSLDMNAALAALVANRASPMAAVTAVS